MKTDREEPVSDGAGSCWGTACRAQRRYRLVVSVANPNDSAGAYQMTDVRDQMKTDRYFKDSSPVAKPPVIDLIPVL
jgi:hypothetical protein